MEALYRDNVKRMRNTLELKVRKAALAFDEQRQERLRKYARYNNLKKQKMQKSLKDNISEEMEIKRKHVLALKHELDEGLSKWSKHVQEVQENNIRIAEKQVEEERSKRR